MTVEDTNLFNYTLPTEKRGKRCVTPEKGYSIIYADPPWRYKDRGCKGNAEAHYPTMTLEDIKTLDVSSIAAPNCVLFMWAVYPLLKEALEVIEAWGFTYKTIAFQWVKLTKRERMPFFGLGRWTRGNTEPCLLAVRGKPQRASKKVSQLIMEPIRHHSAKPYGARRKIVELMGDLPRIELFSRDAVDGWHCWGNEVDSDIVLHTRKNR